MFTFFVFFFPSTWVSDRADHVHKRVWPVVCRFALDFISWVYCLLWTGLLSKTYDIDTNMSGEKRKMKKEELEEAEASLHPYKFSQPQGPKGLYHWRQSAQTQNINLMCCHFFLWHLKRRDRNGSSNPNNLWVFCSPILLSFFFLQQCNLLVLGFVL